MNFKQISMERQSCRSYDPSRDIDIDIINQIIEIANLSPSACNAQPYHLTVCRGESARRVSKATTGMGMNSFTKDVPVMLVISEDSYNKTAALGSRLKGIDYRSIDIGIVCANIVNAAHELGVSSCILGWLDDMKIREIIKLDKKTSLVIALGYARADDKLRSKKRKSIAELVTYID